MKFTVDSPLVNSTHMILEPRNGVMLQGNGIPDYTLEPKKNFWYNLVVWETKVVQHEKNVLFVLSTGQTITYQHRKVMKESKADPRFISVYMEMERLNAIMHITTKSLLECHRTLSTSV